MQDLLGGQQLNRIVDLQIQTEKVVPTSRKLGAHRLLLLWGSVRLLLRFRIGLGVEIKAVQNIP